MISYLNGIVAAIGEKRVVIDVNQVGFVLFVSERDVQAMPGIGEPVKIHTYMSVREDDISLYGFLREDDLLVYKMLITVSGIGPKGGLAILSVMSADDLRLAVSTGDAKAIARAPGIGNKTAQKLILELKDKLKLEDVLEHFSMEEPAGNAGLDLRRSDALQALTSLGYSAQEAMRAVRQVPLTEDMQTEDVLKAALRALAG